MTAPIPRPVTIITSGRPAAGVQALTDGRDLWLTTDDLAAATGWELKPQGACRGEICVPIPVRRVNDFLRGLDGKTWFNVAALAEHTGRSLVHDDEHDVWSMGEPPEEQGAPLAEGVAPDFTLPDLEGQMHALSDQRGKKVLLAAWASW